MCARDLIFVLYGPAWTSSGVVLAILALAMPAYITWAMSTPILWNTNRKHWESLLQFPIIIIAGIAFYNFASQGGVIVAVVTSCVLLLRAIVITSAACHQLKISFRDISGYLLRGLVMSSITVAGCYFGAELGHFLGSGHWYALLGSSVVATIMLIAISLCTPVILGGEVIEMLGRFSPSLSSLLKRRISTFAKVVSDL
jgi:PST family polysaccharide transporter